MARGASEATAGLAKRVAVLAAALYGGEEWLLGERRKGKPSQSGPASGRAVRSARLSGGAFTLSSVSARPGADRVLERWFLLLFEHSLQAPLPWKSFKVTFPNEWFGGRSSEFVYSKVDFGLEN